MADIERALMELRCAELNSNLARYDLLLCPSLVTYQIQEAIRALDGVTALDMFGMYQTSEGGNLIERYQRRR